jgi:hypothetical protein
MVGRAVGGQLSDSEKLILKVEGEDIVIDESFMDFHDFSAEEMQLIYRIAGDRLLIDGAPTAGAAALMLTVKLARGRIWSPETIAEVLEVLTAWLSDNLVEVDS